MPKRKEVSESNTIKLGRPAISPEGREKQLAALAFDLAEERIRKKTASNDLLKEIIKANNTKARLEIEKMKYETELVKVKTEAIESASNAERLFEEAMKAMQEYQGNSQGDVE